MFGIGLVELGVLIVIVLIMLVPLIIVAALVKKVLSGSRGTDGTETEIIQEIHAGLVRMERRIEALETIVLDTDKNARTGK